MRKNSNRKKKESTEKKVKILSSTWFRKRFDTKIPRKYALKVLDHVVRKLASSKRDGRHTQAIMQFYCNGDLLGVAEYSFEYAYDDDGEDILIARQIQAFFSKNTWAVQAEDIDPFENCIRTLLSTEAQNRSTNARLIRNPHSEDSEVNACLYYVQEKISDILGDVPDLNDLVLTFSSGLDTSTHVDKCSPRGKLSNGLTFLPSMTHLVEDFKNIFPNWTRREATACWNTEECPDLWDYSYKHTYSYSRAGTVPKSFKTLRFILTETGLAGMMQRGYGKVMRAKLLENTGVDLSTGKERNMKLAMRSSITNQDATIDMENASNLIAIMAVVTTFPADWVDALSVCRSSHMNVRQLLRQAHISTEEFHRFEMEQELQMFSSMGNGYTFELESILFYSIGFAACRFLGLGTRDIGVVGDDLIVPREAASLIFKVLEFLGFSVNKNKTFTDGPFRESCGGDYFLGTDVRPFYLKKDMTVQQLFVMHNFFLRTGRWDVAAVILTYIPRRFHTFGPDGYGDGHLLGDWSPQLSRKSKRNQLTTTTFFTFSAIPRTWERWAAYYENLYMQYAAQHMSSGDPVDHDVVRGAKGYKKTAVKTLATSIFARKSESNWLPDAR